MNSRLSLHRPDRLALCAAAFALAAAAVAPAPAQARTIVDEWAEVKAPAAPELKPAKLDPKETAKRFS